MTHAKRMILILIPALFSIVWGCGDSGDTQAPADSESEGGSNPDGGDSGDADAGDTEPSAPSYSGVEDYYIAADDDDLTDLCRIRFTVRTESPAPVPCPECEWTVTVRRSDPIVISDEESACTKGDLSWDPDRPFNTAPETDSYGFAPEYSAHAKMLLRLNPETRIWEMVTTAAWNPDSGLFFYDRRDGYCRTDASDPDGPLNAICGMSGEATVSMTPAD